MSIRVIIADDHPLILQGMHTLLARHKHIRLAASFNSGEALLLGLENNEADVLLLDIQMPDKSGDELAPYILKQYPNLRIIVLTNFDSILYVTNMLKHGVHGYLLKTNDEQTLVAAIDSVHRGEIYVAESLREKMDSMPGMTKRIHSSKSMLTAREKEVLQLIVNGMTDPEIAESLFLSHSTVKHYRISILLKMDAKNTATLVNKALKYGLAT